MSAIFGLFHRNQKPVSSNEIEIMGQALAHRGKDGSGVWINGAAGLGHQMLWITPESLTEKLPYYNSNNKLAITADARIDNRQQLFAKLSIPGNEHKNISDSELVLLAYEKWGEQCVEHLVGDYVFAIWDEKNKKLLCVTDPMGMRPVYYYLDDNLFAFSSEIKALLKLPRVPTQLNKEQFARNLTYELSLQETAQTCFKSISLLTSGKSLSVTQNRVKFSDHGQPDFNKTLQLSTESEYLEAFREIFDEAVHCRMRSAYPVSCLLSGGLDSSSIASVAAEKLHRENKQLTAFSRVLGPDHHGPETDERNYIDLVKARWNLDVNYINPAGSGIYEHIDQACYQAETPCVDARHYQLLAFREAAAAQDVRILLDGYGGETSASADGAGYLAELAWRGRWLKLASEIGARSKIERKSLASLFYGQVLRPFTPPWLETLHYRWNKGSIISSINSPIRAEFAANMNVEKQIRCARKLFSIYPHLKKNEARAYSLDQGETPKLFNPSSSIHLYPYLDKRLLEFCLALPPELKVNNGWRRYLIRAGMDGRLPSQVQWRTSKQPFSPDHARRVKAGETVASDILAGVGNDDPIRQFIDIPRLSRDLSVLKQAPELGFNDVYALSGRASIVQRGIYAIVFSQVFPEIF